MNNDKINTYDLIKEYSGFKSIVSPPTDIDMERTKDFKNAKEIGLFIQVLKNNFPSYVLENFYHNLETVDIRYNKFISILGRGGAYNPITNTLIFNKSESIFHELFHMSSRKKAFGRIISGFNQIINYKQLGYVINEGYTEIMTHRYFNVKSNSYRFNQFLARKIEEIVGKEDMEKIYLANGAMILPKILFFYNNGETFLPGILNNDSNISYYSVLDLIEDTDHVLLAAVYAWNFQIYFFDVKKMQIITKSLVYLYANKLKKDLVDGVIDYHEFETKLNSYFADFYNIPGCPLEFGTKLAVKKLKLKEFNKKYLSEVKDFVQDLINQASMVHTESIKV